MKQTITFETENPAIATALTRTSDYVFALSWIVGAIEKLDESKVSPDVIRIIQSSLDGANLSLPELVSTQTAFDDA